MSELKNLFDYGNIRPEHKEAAEEIVNLANQLGQSMIAELIKQKFNITELPTYNLSDSKVAQKLKTAGIHVTVQGHVIDNNIKYPLIGILEDIRKLDKLFE